MIVSADNGCITTVNIRKSPLSYRLLKDKSRSASEEKSYSFMLFSNSVNQLAYIYTIKPLFIITHRENYFVLSIRLYSKEVMKDDVTNPVAVLSLTI